MAPQTWEEQLREAVRPEFAVDVYVPSEDDVVLGRPRCRAARCEQFAYYEPGLCQFHLRRWHAAGSPDLPSFCSAQASEPRPGQMRACRVADCRRSATSRRMCHLHYGRWRSAGQPDLDAWIARQAPAPTGSGTCGVGWCDFPPTNGRNGLCDFHSLRYLCSGHPDVRQFVEQLASPFTRHFDFRPLVGVARQEAQFVLQQKHDEKGPTVAADRFARFVGMVAAAGESLLDGAPEHWLERAPDQSSASLIRYARDRLGLLRDGDVMDWEADVWDLRRALGVRWDIEAGRRIRFDRIPQPWLRDRAKRWARLRLASRSQRYVDSNIRKVVILGEFLAVHDYGSTPVTLRREHLEHFVAWLPSTGLARNTLAGVVTAIRTFFDDCAMHGWNADMSPNVRLVPGDGPGFVTGLPRFISEDVMAQLEDPANIARFTDGPARNLFLIARETGKRIGEITTLPRDPVVIDSTGAPCLTYCDHKSSREGIVPISAIAADAIRDQQHIVAQQHPTSPWLFPRPVRNADGSRHYSTQLFQIRLTEWMRRCDMRDSGGNPITVTSHQFRHTMATRMLNKGVPQHIVQQMLGHVGVDTVATYARLSDTTMRREFERYQRERIDIHGHVLPPTSGSPTADAEWIKHRIGKALQALPDGECGRPIQQACPHPNACLTCDDFLTDASHLDTHRDHLERTRKLIATADQSGNFRMAEMNRHVEQNLVTIIATIEKRATTP